MSRRIISAKKQCFKPLNSVQMKLLMLDSCIWNHLTMCKQMSPYKSYIYKKLFFPFFVISPKREKKNISKWICPQRDLYFFENYLFHSYMHVCFQLVAFVSEHMRHEAIWMGYPMRLKLTCVGLSHWVLYSYGLVAPMFSDESNKLETYTCKNEINNSQKIQISEWINWFWNICVYMCVCVYI